MTAREPQWLAQSAQLSRRSAELRALSEQLRRRARERRQAATKLMHEMCKVFGLARDRRDRSGRQ